ncbi:MAG: hypothetical protein ACREMA_04610 [Longimicrobiales bacterium]
MFRERMIVIFGVCLAGLVTELHAQVTNTASLEVVGGPLAGKHTLDVSDVGCTIFEANKERNKPKYFDVNFGLPPTDPRSRDPRALTFVKVTIRNASVKGPVPQEEYEAAVTFGPLLDRDRETFYMSGFNPTMGRKGGTGIVTLKDEGKSAEVTLDLQPKPGVTVKGTVTCTRVNTRLGGK